MSEAVSALYAPPGSVPNFTVQTLTAALTAVPPTPRLLAELGVFTPKPLAVTTALIEKRQARLTLVPEQPRGAPANRNVMGQRSALTLQIPHFPLSDTVMADSVLGVRAFGSDNQLLGWSEAVNDRLRSMGAKLDATLEWLRLGAVKGVIITSVDRETGAPLQIIDLFAQFNVPPPPAIPFPMGGPGAVTPDAAYGGAIMRAVRQVWRAMQAALGEPPAGIAGICGSDFFDAISLSAEVRATFIATPQAAELRERNLFVPLPYGRIAFHDYGSARVGNHVFVAPDACHFVALGVTDLFIEAYAPAPYVAAVNTIALPRYASQEVLDHNKGVEIETQQNVLPMCTSPATLLTGKLVDAP